MMEKFDLNCQNLNRFRLLIEFDLQSNFFSFHRENGRERVRGSERVTLCVELLSGPEVHHSVQDPGDFLSLSLPLPKENTQ